jgi:hypothetical protein
VLILGRLLDEVRIHQVYLVSLINEKLLVNAYPLVVFGLIVESDQVNVQLWILVTFKTFLKSKYLHRLTHALLNIVDQMHMLKRADHDKQDLV